MLPRSILAVPLLLLVLLVAPLAADEEGDAPAPRPELGPSWKDRGAAAYEGRDFAEAAYWYRRWLEADPRDEGTWYNLACCLALADLPGKAVEAFERAVDAGWRDAAWPLEDPDLETVREEERFVAALERAAASVPDDGPSSYARHWITIPTIGTYLALLPPDYETSETSYPLVVILHGNGSSELGHGRVGDAAGRDGVIYVVPRAPHPNWGAFAGTGRPGWTWRPDASDEDLAGLAPTPARLYVDSVLAAVDDARARYRIADGPFHVFGHSMGGFFANVTAALHPERVASFFAYAGGLPEEFRDEEHLAGLRTHGVKAVHVHGTADAVVPPSASREAHERMAAAGVDSTLHLVEGAGHGIHPEVAARLRVWIRTEVRGEPAEE